MKVLVLTISDRASKGEYEDQSGPAVERALTYSIPEVVIVKKVVSDDSEAIKKAFQDHLDNDVILTTGGTGIGPRDNTPDVTEEFCEKMIPGIPELLRKESCTQTKNAVLSRAVAGIIDKTLIVNLPGSVKGAQFCTKLLTTILPHAIKMMHGEGH